MASIGPGFKGHSLHELRGILLKNCVYEVQDYLLDIKKKKLGSAWFFTNGRWLDKSKQQSIINFLVYSAKGAMFLKSIDVSGLRKDAETLVNIFNEVVLIIPFSYS